MMRHVEASPSRPDIYPERWVYGKEDGIPGASGQDALLVGLAQHLRSRRVRVGIVIDVRPDGRFDNAYLATDTSEPSNQHVAVGANRDRREMMEQLARQVSPTAPRRTGQSLARIVESWLGGSWKDQILRVHEISIAVGWE